MSRKRKSRWILGLLTAGLLACQMPAAALAAEVNVPAEVKIPDEEGAQKEPERKIEEALKPDHVENAITPEPEAAKAADAARENKINLQADDTDKSQGLVFEWLYQVPKEETVYTAGGGEMIWTPVLEENQVVGGTLTLRNAVVNSTKTAIHFPVPVDIKVEGGNQITSGSAGIYLLDKEKGNAPKLTITGPGSLAINSQTDGIQATGGVSIDTVRLDVGYSSNGIFAIRGDVIIQNCEYIKIKNNPGIGSSSGAVRASQSGNGTIRIENSHVIAVNEAGPAISAGSGKVELIASDVRAVGNTNTENATGTLEFKECIMDGGTLFAQNNGTDSEIALVSTQPIKAANSAVIYGVQSKYILPLEGDCAWYLDCMYDEDADEVSVPGRGYIFGDVVWNDNLYLGDGKTITIGRYSKKDSSLTIPEGTTLDMPAGSKLNIRGSDTYQTKSNLIVEGTLNMQEQCEINNYSNCMIGEKGTLNIKGSQAGFYNYYSATSKIEGVVQNKGNLNISSNAAFQNQNRLENSGTIHTTGNFSTILITGYHAVVENTGTIDGFVIEMHNDSYVNVANGKTVVVSGETLTLGAGAADSGARSRILKVSDGAELTVEEGAVIDAKTNVTADEVSTYIDLSDTMIVNGQLWLPSAVPDETMSKLAEKIAGNGEVLTGDTKKYIITVQIGDSSETKFVEEGGQVNLPENPVRDGYRFTGWYVKDAENLKPFEPQTPITQSMEIISKWFGINEWTEPLSIENWSYGETANEPKAAAKFGEIHYTYSDSQTGEFTGKVPEQAGIWYVKAAVNETEDYAGLESEAVSFRIEPKAYEENGSITISAITNAEDVKNLVIRDGSKELERDVDYTVSVSESGKEGTVTIVFQGNYTGNITRTYQISEEKPVEPEKPSKPEQPGASGEPERPVTPEESGKPVIPEESGKPEQPDITEEPDKPEQPDITEEPNKPEQPDITQKPEQPDTPSQPAAINKKARVSISGAKLRVSWSKVNGADGYDVYAEKCASNIKLVKTVQSGTKTSAVISKIGKQKISEKGSYKVQIRAYRITDGKKEILVKTLTFHIVGKNNKKYTNAKNIKISETNLTIKAGATKKIKAQIIKQNQKKTLLPEKHVAIYRYYSTDRNIASVSKSGIIKAKRKGSCTVYTVAANGAKKGIKVTVK